MILMIKKQIVINNKTGLHARPAAIFVQTASKFKSFVQIVYKEKSYDAKSILSVLSAGIECGAIIELIVDGEDEKSTFDVLRKLIENKFGE